MRRKLLLIVAFLGMAGSFALAVRYLYRFADQYCPWAEAGGNCHAFVNVAARDSIVIFGVSAIAFVILLLLPNSRSTDE